MIDTSCACHSISVYVDVLSKMTLMIEGRFSVVIRV